MALHRPVMVSMKAPCIFNNISNASNVAPRAQLCFIDSTIEIAESYNFPTPFFLRRQGRLSDYPSSVGASAAAALGAAARRPVACPPPGRTLREGSRRWKSIRFAGTPPCLPLPCLPLPAPLYAACRLGARSGCWRAWRWFRPLPVRSRRRPCRRGRAWRLVRCRSRRRPGPA